MDQRNWWPRGWRGLALLVVAGVMLANLISPAIANIGTVNHLWKQHIKPKADARYVNEAGTLPAGTTLTGVYSAWGNGSGGYIGDAVTYRSPLAAELDGAHVIFIPDGGATDATCPGSGQAAEGYLCVYERGSGGATLGQIYRSSNPGGGTGSSVAGFGIYFNTASAGGNWSYGEWAVSGPAAAATRPAAPRGTTPG